jgi:lactoylglutathione lyase
MPKFLHTRIRVGDLERSIRWYEQLGFRCTRRSERPLSGNQLAFL